MILLTSVFVFLLTAASGLSVNYDIPKKYQHNRTVTIVELTQKQIDKQCGIPADPTEMTLACADINGHTVYISNSCLATEAKNYHSYAHLLCHEIAHTEGWVHD